MSGRLPQQYDIIFAHLPHGDFIGHCAGIGLHGDTKMYHIDWCLAPDDLYKEDDVLKFLSDKKWKILANQMYKPNIGEAKFNPGDVIWNKQTNQFAMIITIEEKGWEDTQLRENSRYWYSCRFKNKKIPYSESMLCFGIDKGFIEVSRRIKL